MSEEVLTLVIRESELLTLLARSCGEPNKVVGMEIARDQVRTLRRHMVASMSAEEKSKASYDAYMAEAAQRSLDKLIGTLDRKIAENERIARLSALRRFGYNYLGMRLPKE